MQGWIMGLVFVGALFAADHFGWPVQGVLIVAIFLLLVAVGKIEPDLVDACRAIVDLEEKLKDKTRAVADESGFD